MKMKTLIKAYPKSRQVTEYRCKIMAACAAAKHWDQPKVLGHPLI